MSGVTFGKRNHGRIISMKRNTEQIFEVETVVLVPTVYRFVVSAADDVSACRLAAEIVRQRPDCGLPDYAGRSESAVRDLRIMPTGEPSRPVPVPPAFRLGA